MTAIFSSFFFSFSELFFIRAQHVRKKRNKCASLGGGGRNPRGRERSRSRTGPEEKQYRTGRGARSRVEGSLMESLSQIEIRWDPI